MDKFIALHLQLKANIIMTFKYSTTVSFHDCDPAGIMFYGRAYFVAHSAYETMISSFQLDEDYWNNSEYVVPIIKSEAAYRKPFKYGEIVKVDLIVNQLRSSSFELFYEMSNAAGELCIEVKTVHVVVDKVEWKKKQMGKKLAEGFEKFLQQKI